MGAIQDINTAKPITPGIVNIWVIDLDTIDERIENYYGLLSKDERSKTKKFKFERDRNNFTVCRGVLRRLSALYLGTRPQDIKFGYSEFGKPHFIESTLKFNVSHSGNVAVIGFLEGQEIGIDVELVKTNFDVLDIANNFFSEKEIKALNELPHEIQSLAFYRCWTRKEAFIKAEGSGLSFPLDSFAVSMDSDEIATLLETVWDRKEKEKWILHSFVPSSGYRAALAVRRKVNSIEIQKWHHM